MSYSTDASPRPSAIGAAERRTGGVKAADLIPPRAIETGDRLATGFTPMERRVFDLVNRCPGLTTEQLHARIYCTDPNGGANLKTLHVIIHKLNKKLLQNDLRIFAGSGSRNGYRMEKINTGGFTIDLPLPPSVNRSQAKLGNKSPGIAKWRRLCDGYLFAEWRTLKQQAVKGEFAVGITWTAAEFGHSDWDNRIKPLMDYLQDRELIENDKLCRAAQVGFGLAPFGCRVVVRPAS